MPKLIDFIERLVPFNSKDTEIKIPKDLRDNFVAYYPGSGEDRRFFDMLQNRSCSRIIYQDSGFSRELILDNDLLSKVETKSSTISGKERINADLIYIPKLGIELARDTLVEKIMNNAKDDAYIIGKDSDISLIGILTENVNVVNNNMVKMIGKYAPSMVSFYLGKYPTIMRSILETVLQGTRIDKIPDLSAEFYLQSTNLQSSSIVEGNKTHFLNIIKKELNQSNSGDFYSFLGDYTPEFVNEAKRLL